jgi:hypothetical protein
MLAAARPDNQYLHGSPSSWALDNLDGIDRQNAPVRLQNYLFPRRVVKREGRTKRCACPSDNAFST